MEKQKQTPLENWTRITGKLIHGRPDTPPSRTSQDSSFVVEGHQIPLSPQEDPKPKYIAPVPKLNNMVEEKTKEKEVGTNDNNEMDEADITTRAIKACLAAEAALASLREECNLLPDKSEVGQTTNSHARRGCDCPGKGAIVCLQLQLAACDNLSFAATSAIRELVAIRLGVPMLKPLRSTSPKKQHKKEKKAKKPSSNEDPCNFSTDMQSQSPRRDSMSRNKRKSLSGERNSLPKEQCNAGPFTCLDPLTHCTPLCERPSRNSSICNHGPIEEKPLPECFPGTLLNSRSILTRKTADALRAAIKIGVLVVIATGKTRPAAMAALDPMGLAGKGGIVSDLTPGVFIQGLQVFGKKGKIIHNIALEPSIVEETFAFSVKHQAPLVGFCGDRCVTLFPHTMIDELHDVFYEPQAEVLECMDQMKKVKVQKVVFHDDAERVTSFLRPHWSLALQGRANVVQSLPDMLEVLPSGASKGAGVQTLLDHLNVSPDQVMAIGDGENDIEMLTLAGWGVAMGNANSLVKFHAKAVTTSNDEDGVAKAIEEYIL